MKFVTLLAASFLMGPAAFAEERLPSFDTEVFEEAIQGCANNAECLLQAVDEALLSGAAITRCDEGAHPDCRRDSRDERRSRRGGSYRPSPGPGDVHCDGDGRHPDCDKRDKRRSTERRGKKRPPVPWNPGPHCDGDGKHPDCP